ncbi:MAG: hypothetical protein J1F07_02060 [Muribaculaceae bacterium]|nr:hypothetical protein [Muribaculaceae bacterium]
MSENKTQQPGQPATVSAAAEATGGINAGNFIETAIDEELFRFNSDDTPLMQLMLRAKRVKVDSPEVDHYMIDEPVAEVTTNEALTAGNRTHAPLPLEARDQNVLRTNATVLVPDVDGYDESGAQRTPGKPLMLFVTGHDNVSGNPVVRAVNGQKDSPADEECVLPDIPKGSRVVILANSLYETQKEVDPDLVVPQATRIYLQKRGMNQVVSDYFDSQRKRIPFSKAIIAEQAIANFKVRGNRTLWAGRQSKFKVSVPRMGMQHIYTTEGIRWQFRRELQMNTRWTVEKIIALAKMFFTGEDVPKSALLLAGKNLLEQLQTIDYSKHPEIQLTTRTNSVGWVVTSLHTVFGDIDIKREPTLDRIGWSNSGALIGEDRLVHYVYSAEHSFSDRMETEEATRSGILIWDALALKGSCHIWIDGEGDTGSSTAMRTIMWEGDKAPSKDIVEGNYFYLLEPCREISDEAQAGQIWFGTLVGGGGIGPTIEWQRYA